MGDRVAILVDGNNIAHSSRRYGMIVDYGALLSWAARGGPRHPDGSLVRGLSYAREVVAARVYLGPSGSNGSGNGKRKNFMSLMQDLGFEVIVSAEEGNPSKTAVDRDITIDALLLAYNGQVDRILLLSGDGGFTRLVKVLNGVGVQVEVCAFPNASKVLRQAARRFWDLTKIVGATMTKIRTDCT